MRAPRAPGVRAARRARPASSGRSDSAAGSRSFSSRGRQLRRRGPRPGRAAGRDRGRPGRAAPARGAQAVELGVDVGRREAALVRAPARAPSRGSSHRLDPLARPGHDRVRGAHLARHVAAERGRHGRAAPARSSGSPASALAARSTAAASALPPPRPAATGIRLSIVDPQRRQRRAGRGGAERGQRPRRPGSRPPRPGRRPRPTSASSHRDLVGEVDRGEQRAQRVQPVRAAARPPAARG